MGTSLSPHHRARWGKQRRELAKMNLCAFNDNLAMLILICSPTKDLSLHVTIYDSQLPRLMDTHAPLKTKTVVERTNCEWFTNELGELKHHLWALDRKYKLAGLAVEQEIYKLKSDEYEQCHVAIKQLYYTKDVLDCDGKQGATFNSIKLLHQSR